MIWTDNMLIPKGAANKYTAELMMNCVYDVDRCRADRQLRLLHLAGEGRRRGIKALDPEAATNPLLFPPPDVVAKQHSQPLSDEIDGRRQRAVRGPVRRLSAVRPDARRRPRRPTAGSRGRWLHPVHAAGARPALADPLLRHARTSRCSDVALDRAVGRATGVRRSPGRSRTTARGSTTFAEQFLNSIVYGGLATILCLLIGYPAGLHDRVPGRPLQEPAPVPRHRPVLHELPDPHDQLEDHPRRRRRRSSRSSGTRSGIVPGNFSILGTPLAVVAGLTYKFLPFMVLPLYVVAREDRPAADRGRPGPVRRTVAAAAATVVGGIVGGVLAVVSWPRSATCARRRRPRRSSRPARRRRARSARLIATFLISESFVRVTFPLSLPGVFAGSILTFIPAMGDYINAELLGNPQTQMIGNVIQNRSPRPERLPDRRGPVVHPDGRHPGRDRPLRAGPRHRGADRRTAMTATATPARRRRARPPRGSLWQRVDRWLLPVFTVARARLPDAADRGDDPVLVQRSAGRFNFVWGEFSLQGWLNPFGRPGLGEARPHQPRSSRSSRRSSRPSSGTLIGLALTRYQFRGRVATNRFIFLPMATPEIVLGASLLTLFVATAQRAAGQTLTGGSLFPLGSRRS